MTSAPWNTSASELPLSSLSMREDTRASSVFSSLLHSTPAPTSYFASNTSSTNFPTTQTPTPSIVHATKASHSLSSSSHTNALPHRDACRTETSDTEIIRDLVVVFQGVDGSSISWNPLNLSFVLDRSVRILLNSDLPRFHKILRASTSSLPFWNSHYSTAKSPPFLSARKVKYRVDWCSR